MNGLKHSTHRSGSRVSRRHSYSKNCGGVMLSTPVKLNVAARLLLTSGGFSTMIVCGGLVSAPSMWWIVGRLVDVAGAVDGADLEDPRALFADERHRPRARAVHPHQLGRDRAPTAAIGSGASVSSSSTRRHSNWSSSVAVRLSLPVNVKAIGLERVLDRPGQVLGVGIDVVDRRRRADELVGAGVALAVLRARDAALVGGGARAHALVDGQAPVAERRSSASGRRCRRARRGRRRRRGRAGPRPAESSRCPARAR